MGTSSIGRRARRAGFLILGAFCACAIGAAAAQAQTLTWSNPEQPDSVPGTLGITAVSCFSTSLCVAVDDAGQDVATTNPTSGAWTTNPGQIGPATPRLTGVSCPSTTLCVATDRHGNVYASATPATTTTSLWTLEPNIDGTGGTADLTAISCPSTSLCVAVDNTGNIVTSTAPGNAASWTTKAAIETSTPITAVSCPTTTLCAAVDSAGRVLVSTTPTIAGSWASTTLTSGALDAVSCTTSGLCVATAANGSVYATPAVTTAPVTWTATPVDAHPLSAVSCTDAGFCVLLDGNGDALTSDTPAASQPNWAFTQISTQTNTHDLTLTAVSCVDAGLCLAADHKGDTLTATFAGPSVATGTATVSSQTTAAINGTVNPDDVPLSDCHFDYGTSTSYGSTVPCTVVPSATGGAQSVTATVSGLNAQTVYHFRLDASSAVATSDGSDATFTTPAALKPSPSISGNSAAGSTLTCRDNVTTTAAETVSYQWLSDTNPIAAATAPTYVIQTTDESHHLSCEVTISGDGGSASAVSGYDGVPAQSGATVTESFVGTDKKGATSVSAPLTCSPQSSKSCSFKLVLTAIKTANHVSQKVTVGSTSTTMGSGARRTVTVSLNSTGRSLLKKHHSLAVTLTVSGTVIGTLTATLQTDKLVFTQKGRRLATHHARTR
jgi:hypothetical protein